MRVKAAIPSISRRQWLVAACACWAWPARAGDDPRRPWPRRRRTPALQLPRLDGGTWSLAAARGHPVLLNFWASWCEPCRAEMPSLQRLAARHRAQGLQVMAVNYREGDDALRRFTTDIALDLPVLCDRDGDAAKAFDVHVFPSTVAIDRQGRAVFVVTGEADWSGAAAERWLAALL
jgi:thiol-disulfide isomerase/thioredoxin